MNRRHSNPESVFPLWINYIMVGKSKYSHGYAAEGMSMRKSKTIVSNKMTLETSVSKKNKKPIDVKLPKQSKSDSKSQIPASTSPSWDEYFKLKTQLHEMTEKIDALLVSSSLIYQNQYELAEILLEPYSTTPTSKTVTSISKHSVSQIANDTEDPHQNLAETVFVTPKKIRYH